MSNLTNKQRLFIEEYLQCWNATEAARRAGYAGSDATLGVVGYENLRKPKIEAIIHQRLAEAAMGADEVLSRLAEQARGLSEDFFAPDGSLDMAVVVAESMTHLVKKTRQTKYGLDVELYDAQAALVQIGRAHGLFKDKVDVKTEGELRVVYIDDWRDKAPKATPGPADSDARPSKVQVAGGGAAVAQDDDGDERGD